MRDAHEICERSYDQFLSMALDECAGSGGAFCGVYHPQGYTHVHEQDLHILWCTLIAR